jgi:uncharacterized protein (TIGR00369 family)
MVDDEQPHPDMARFLSRLPFFQTFGMNVLAADPGRMVIAMAYDARFSTPPDLFPAALVGAIGDVAAIASCTSLQPPGRAAVTIDFTVKMLAPARGERLIAYGRVLQNGGANSVGAADVFAVAGGVQTLCGTVLATARNFEMR